jgi:glycosyltransferase involved in cell wall biosynthesis
MKVFYHHAAGGNVGDDLNAVLWQHLLPDLQRLDTAEWLIGIGTILDERLNALEGRKVIVGSGLRPGARLPALTGDVRFASVRGKLTAERLLLGPDVPLGDPGFLVNSLLPPELNGAAPSPSGRVGFVPHVYSERWSHISDAARDAGLQVISPTLAVSDFLRELMGCSRVFCESLHAAIFAEALRIPWSRVRISSHYYEGDGVSDFKWRDAFSVVEAQTASAIKHTLIPIRRSWMRPLQAMAERRLVAALVARRDDEKTFQLADEGQLNDRRDALLKRIQDLTSSVAVNRWPAASVRPRRESYVRVLMFPKNVDNPYVRRLAAVLEHGGAVIDEFTYRRALTDRYDVLHLHWPDSHLASRRWWGALIKHGRFACAVGLLRLRGAKIVWTLHNLKPHDANHWISEQLFRLWVPRLCTHVIALTSDGLEAARTLYPGLRHKASVVIPHGHYRDDYAAAPPRREARAQLGLPEDRFTFLFFGNVRRYKNVPQLIQEFRVLQGDDVHLVIAGLPGHGIDSSELEQLRGDDERVSLRLKFVPESAVPTYFGAADAVVLPFDSILNSGSVLLALSFNRRVLAPRLGALPEIQQEVGADWLSLYDGSLTADMLDAFRLAQSGRTDDEVDRADLSTFGWNSIAERTLDFYRKRVSRGDDARLKRTQGGGAYDTPKNEYSQS